MKVHILDFDDWVALYLNGEKKLEGHSLHLQDVLELLDVDCEYEFVEEGTPLGDYIMFNGIPPMTMEEVDSI